MPHRRLLDWLADLDDDVTRVTVDGVDAFALTVDLDALATTKPSDAVHLLPGYDPWVMGPGTSDARILSPERRALATRGANLVIWGGIVAGTWRMRGGDVTVSWFNEAGPVPRSALEDQVRRLAAIHARGQSLTLRLA